MILFDLKPVKKKDFIDLIKGPMSARTIQRKIKQIEDEVKPTRKHYYTPNEYFKILHYLDFGFTETIDANKEFFFNP